MHDYISGIQQIGIGVKDASSSMHRYKQLFGMSTLVFNDISDASLMSKYTGGKVYNRQAVLSLNMQGGGGFEIWQYINRNPEEPCTIPLPGDFGIYAAKIKCSDIEKAYQQFSKETGLSISPVSKDLLGRDHFYVRDPYNNVFNIIPANHWFNKNGNPVGGVTGAVIGVQDMDKALSFYTKVLSIDKIVYDETTVCEEGIAKGLYRKVLLQKTCSGKGAFGKLLGPVEIELVQSLDRGAVKIYADRFWGDCGFIHLCFDVLDMDALKQHAGKHGYDFTVDSVNSFGMENASGRFCYMEDPDGTLIELVETHRVPIFKKLGLYLNLKKRNLAKPLPDWMIKMMSISKVK